MTILDERNRRMTFLWGISVIFNYENIFNYFGSSNMAVVHMLYTFHILIILPHNFAPEMELRESEPKVKVVLVILLVNLWNFSLEINVIGDLKEIHTT